MKKIRIIFCFAIILFSSSSYCQITDEKAIKQVIETLFDGMRKGDSTMVRSAFYKDATLQTAMVNKTGDTVLRKETIDKFVKAVGRPHDKIWNEIIWAYDIKIDGLMASVWAPYTFYSGDTLSHCGVNAFLLFRSKEGWKIVSIMDTRRKEGCKEK